MPNPPLEQLPAPARRRLTLRALVQPVCSAAALVTLYFVLPMGGGFSSRTLWMLAGGLAVVGALVTWQARSIARSSYPRLRAFQALSISAPLFLLLFATTYYLLDRSQPDAFTEPLTKLDSFYFTVTVFSTVGFGDIAARSESARALVTVQMIGDLIVIGLVLRVLLNAVQVGLSRRPGSPPHGE
jgi:voltage-gated potassium channel